MGRKVFISVLGTGFYGACKYVKDGFVSTETRFIQQATLEYVKAHEWGATDTGIFLLTQRAKETNWDKTIASRQNMRLNISESYEGLESILEKMELPFKCQSVYIHDGKDEDEMWGIFNEIFNQIEEGDELYFDLTHSFRYLPMLVLVLNNYAKFLKNVTTKHISYGNYEARNTSKNEAPIVDLLPLSSLQDWTFAAADYIKNGNTKMIASLSSDKIVPRMKESSGQDSSAASVKTLVNYLNLFAEDMSTCRGLIICDGSRIKKTIASLNEFDKDFIKYLSPITKKIEESFVCFKNKEGAMLAIAAARWCFDHGMHQQAVTLLQEGIITFFCERHGLNIRDEDDRKIITTTFYLLSKKYQGISIEGDMTTKIKELLTDEYLQGKEIVNEFSHLSKVRNDIDHSGMRPEGQIESKLISKIKKYLESFEKRFQYENVDINSFVRANLIFINLSNHPSDSWDENQRDAAKKYGECVDLPFPEIDPTWNEEKIEELANAYCDKVLHMADTYDQITVHLMGELTFCFSLLKKLQHRGIRCVASCAKRNVEEEDTGVKRSVFSFENFREYSID